MILPRRNAICVLAGLCCLLILSQPLPAQQDLAGDWEGRLKVGATSLRVAFHITVTEDGLTATMDSPDQGATGLPVSDARLHNGELILTVAAVGGQYRGKVVAQEIDGVWQQSGREFPLKLYRPGSDAAAAVVEEESVLPIPYSAIEVTYRNEKSDIELAGTLTMPESDQPVAALLLLSGSGPQDRDQNILGHRPFAVIADYLTRRGIAIMRVDDRGVGKSGGDFNSSSESDFVEDAIAGLNYLNSRSDVDPAKIGLLGHSEGGLIAARVAAQRRDIAMLIMLAAPGIPGEELLLLQAEKMLTATNADANLIRENRAVQEQVFLRIRELFDQPLTQTDLEAILNQSGGIVSASNRTYFRDALKQQLTMLNAPWFRELLMSDPMHYLAQVICPVLALNGSKDLQVPAAPNLAGIEAALNRSGNRDVELHELRGLNHLFQTAETGLPEEYATIKETISPDVLKMIGDWVSARK